MALKLDMTNAPSTLFLFGLSGAGKSYMGDLIGALSGWHVYHADDDITDEMKLALTEKRPFTEAMRDRYFPIIVEKIKARQKKHSHIVVTQGAYKRKHRSYLLENISEIELICVETSDQLISQRVMQRGVGIENDSAVALRNDFEQAVAGTKIIVNDGDDTNIITQLNNFYSEKFVN